KTGRVEDSFRRQLRHCEDLVAVSPPLRRMQGDADHVRAALAEPLERAPAEPAVPHEEDLHAVFILPLSVPTTNDHTVKPSGTAAASGIPLTSGGPRATQAMPHARAVPCPPQ